MNSLTPNDLRYVVQRLPRDVRSLLSAHHRQLFVGGGFIRATIAGEVPSDIDVFGNSAERVELAAADLAASRPGSKVHRSKNAITVMAPDRLTVQFITRWTFDKPRDLVSSFDFTVCQATIWRDGLQSNSAWRSAVGSAFYVDLAGRRLVYTNPVREEEAGGSMLRVLKYLKRGYTIQVQSLADVIARLTTKIDPARVTGERDHAFVLAGLLREVDPSLVIDGFEVVDDHEPAEDLNGASFG